MVEPQEPSSSSPVPTSPASGPVVDPPGRSTRWPALVPASATVAVVGTALQVPWGPEGADGDGD